jgi:hypothetical protein
MLAGVVGFEFGKCGDRGDGGRGVVVHDRFLGGALGGEVPERLYELLSEL